MVPRRAMLMFKKKKKKQSKVCGSLFCDFGSQEGKASCRVVDLCYADTYFIAGLLEIPWKAFLQLELITIVDLVGKPYNITLLASFC